MRASDHKRTDGKRTGNLYVIYQPGGLLYKLEVRVERAVLNKWVLTKTPDCRHGILRISSKRNTICNRIHTERLDKQAGIIRVALESRYLRNRDEQCR